jgi:hypothetical protein
MSFYNHCLEGETMTAVVSFPFTPDTIRDMSDLQVFSLGKVLGFTYNEELGVSVGDTFRQKLFDMWYYVEDSSRMHAIVPCQSRTRRCNNLASSLSGNYMCKVCQLELQNRKPSLIHDSHDQFFRYKIRMLYTFEEEKEFDRKKTVRVSMRRMLKRYELEKMFKDYLKDFLVDVNKVEVYYSPETHRMQYIYLPCRSHEEAKRVLQNKHALANKASREDLKFESLPSPLSHAHQAFREPEHTLVLITPPSSLEVVEELPKAEELLTQIQNLVQVLTQLDMTQFTLETDSNPITGEKDYRHIFINLPNRTFVDRIYEAQPFFGCLVAHKLTHPQITPFLRYAPDVCLMCNNEKHPNNILDMCIDCCSKQKHYNIMCPTAASAVQDLALKRKEYAKEMGVPLDSLCDKSPNLKLKGDPNNLCKSVYQIQAIYIPEPHHERSVYWESLRELSPIEMSRQMLSQVSEMHTKVRNELRNGRYDWFKPIYGSNIEEYMIKANKELQEVINNGNLIRGQTTKKMLKEGKVFTFQANVPLSYNINSRVSVYENIDQKGVPFVEYSYDSPNPKELWNKSSSNKQRTYAYEDFIRHINSPNLKIKDTFHLMFLGLDKVNLSIKELYQEIFIKLKTLVGEVKHEHIMVLDNDSLLVHIFNTPLFKHVPNLDQHISVMGRIACVEMSNVLDAIAILNKNVKLNLPLNNGTNDEPLIMPSKSLINFILDFNPQSTPVNFMTAGQAFAPLNKEIETINVETKNIMLHNSNSDNFRVRSKNKGGNFKGRKGDPSSKEEVRGGPLADRQGNKPYNKKSKRKRVD